MKFIIPNIEAINSVAADFLRANVGKRVFAFIGELGVGKTTFIKALCEQLGVTDTMSSPSFSIVNEYRDANGKPIYHFDLYRIKSAAELSDIGFEEYLFSGNYCFIEWPEKADGMLPDDMVMLTLEEVEDHREISTLRR